MINKVTGLVLAGAALVACTPSSGSGIDRNLECAALISAVSYLVVDGSLENDPEFTSRGLTVMMHYVASYAVPNQISEADAFEELHARRDTLIEENAPNTIKSRAKRCISKSRM